MAAKVASEVGKAGSQQPLQPAAGIFGEPAVEQEEGRPLKQRGENPVGDEGRERDLGSKKYVRTILHL